MDVEKYSAPHSQRAITIRAFPLLALFFLLTFLTPQIHAQSNEATNLKLNKAYLKSYLNDAADIAIAPIRWKNKQWLGFAAVAGVTLLAYSQDEVINDFFQRQQTAQKDQISKYVFDPMPTYYLAGFLGGMYVYGLTANDSHTETAALLTGKAVVLTGAYTYLFKSLTQRQRPYQATPADPGYWGGPFDGFHYNSFPSGHTSVAFAAATVLSAYYKDRKWVGISAFSLAGLVALSRSYDQKHWASDVVAGAALGYAIGRLVYNKHQNRRFGIYPYTSYWGNGLSLSLKI